MSVSVSVSVSVCACACACVCVCDYFFAASMPLYPLCGCAAVQLRWFTWDGVWLFLSVQGQFVDVLDKFKNRYTGEQDSRWRLCEIVDTTSRKLKVHFVGWSEYVQLLVAPCGRRTAGFHAVRLFLTLPLMQRFRHLDRHEAGGGPGGAAGLQNGRGSGKRGGCVGRP